MSADIYGYVRVSTREQNEKQQLEEMSIPEKHLFIDKQSGENFRRTQYQKMVKGLKTDDLLYIMSIDRLDRKGQGPASDRSPGLCRTVLRKCGRRGETGKCPCRQRRPAEVYIS